MFKTTVVIISLFIVQLFSGFCHARTGDTPSVIIRLSPKTLQKSLEGDSLNQFLNRLLDKHRISVSKDTSVSDDIPLTKIVTYMLEPTCTYGVSELKKERVFIYKRDPWGRKIRNEHGEAQGTYEDRNKVVYKNKLSFYTYEIPSIACLEAYFSGNLPYQEVECLILPQPTDKSCILLDKRGWMDPKHYCEAAEFHFTGMFKGSSTNKPLLIIDPRLKSNKYVRISIDRIMLKPLSKIPINYTVGSSSYLDNESVANAKDVVDWYNGWLVTFGAHYLVPNEDEPMGGEMTLGFSFLRSGDLGHKYPVVYSDGVYLKSIDIYQLQLNARVDFFNLNFTPLCNLGISTGFYKGNADKDLNVKFDNNWFLGLILGGGIRGKVGRLLLHGEYSYRLLGDAAAHQVNFGFGAALGGW